MDAAISSRYVRDASFYKKFALLAIPIIFQNIITQAVNLADNVMVSNLGEIVLDGVYATNVVSTFVGQIIHGIAPAMIVLAAQYWGKGDRESVKKIVSIGIKLCFLCTAAISLLMITIPTQMLSIFNSNPEVIAAGVPYARIMGFGYLFFCISNVLISAMRCVESVRIGMIDSILALIINVTLNYLLINGNLGFPALGVVGAALATVIARLAECVLMIWFVFFHDKQLGMKLSDVFGKSDPQLTSDFFRYGLPVFIGSITWGINLSVQGMIVGRFDVNSIAAYSIASTVFSILTVGAYGSATASSIVIGKAVGNGDMTIVKQYARTLQLIFVGVGIITGSLIWFSRPLVLALYSYMGELEALTFKYADQFLRVLAVCSVGTSYQMSVNTGIVRAGGDTKFVLINDLIFVWCVVLPSAAISAFILQMPTWVTVACLKCDQILKCIVAFIKVNRWRWMKKLTR
ncbi:MAG: MATE family efflux transporter [Eubacteriales bacterium]|jgi:putative MATE family efflux protein